jgi:hypothetical protein
MPRDYQQYLDSIPVYEPPRKRTGKLGAAIFLAIWGPVMSLMEKMTYATMKKDGYAPRWVIILVRSIVMLLWFTHDAFFAPVFGRGDGYTEAVPKEVRSKEHSQTEQQKFLERDTEKFSFMC